ncbi:MAG: YIP1 family protein [Candidatus Gracilibacteria bacterium]
MKFDFIKDGLEVLKLNKAKMSQVAGDNNATTWAFVILGVPFVVNIILVALQTTLFLSMQVKLLLIPLISIIAVIFLMSIVAQQLFHAKGSHMAFFRVVAYAGVAMWASVIPFILGFVGVADVYSIFNLINLFAGIWMLVVTYHVLIDYYKLNQQNAIITIVLGIVGAAILQNILGRILIGQFYSLMY